MILKIYLPVIILITLGLTGHGCFDLFSFPKKLVKVAFKSALPFDPSTGLHILSAIPTIKKEFDKIKNETGSPIPGVFTETKDLIKDKIYLSSFKEDDISFFLYQPNNDNLVALNWEDISETEGKLFLITHGWMENSKESVWQKQMAKALLDTSKNSKVVLVDWGSNSFKYLYALAASRTKSVGEVVADKIVAFVLKYNFSLENVILIGYDLGAHVCGYAGKLIFKATKQKVSEIIGLDPSAISFATNTNERRLHASDADIVMVLHTESSKLGFAGDCGTIDFYANGGYLQPGCSEWNLLCNHQRSYELFTAAIGAPKEFPTKKCEDLQEYQNNLCLEDNVFFGNISETKTGKYFFATGDTPPFYPSTLNKKKLRSLSLLRWG